MIHKVARYVVKEDEVDRALAAIAEFVAEVRNREPGTVYHAYQSDDGVTFVHFMGFPDAAAEEAHRVSSHTGKFVDTLYALCEETPVFSDLSLIESTRGGKSWRGGA